MSSALRDCGMRSGSVCGSCWFRFLVRGLPCSRITCSRFRSTHKWCGGSVHKPSGSKRLALFGSGSGSVFGSGSLLAVGGSLSLQTFGHCRFSLISRFGCQAFSKYCYFFGLQTGYFRRLEVSTYVKHFVYRGVFLCIWGVCRRIAKIQQKMPSLLYHP
jgi:hypothetical protein